MLKTRSEVPTVPRCLSPSQCRHRLKGSTEWLLRRRCSKTRKFYSFKNSLHTTPLSPLLSQRRVSANKIYLQHQRSSRIPTLRQRKEDQSRISVQTWTESQLPSHGSRPILWAKQLNSEGKACSSADYVEQKLIEGISLRFGSPFIFPQQVICECRLQRRHLQGKHPDPTVTVRLPPFICFSG